MSPILGLMSNMTNNIFQVKHSLSQLTTVKGDLIDLVAPPSALAPKSQVEIPSAWASCQDLFLQPASEPDAGQRALLVAKNYVCSLKTLVGQGTDELGKKPLTPFLGELFLGEFRGKQSTTCLISEQVSHQPPVTACCMYNPDQGITSTGFVAQSTTFNPSSGVAVKQNGYVIIRDEKHQESHLFTLPTLAIKGLVSGHPYSELQGPCYISSSSGYITRIDFGNEGKPRSKSKLWSSDSSRDRVEAVTTKAAQQQSSIIYRIVGQWTGKLSVFSGAGDKAAEEFHVNDIPLTELSVRPVDQQTPWESRRAWSKVIQGIGAGDMGSIRTHKTAIEESQRKRRATEQATGGQWQRMFFSCQERDDDAQRLLSQIPDPAVRSFDAVKTGGFWKFVGAGTAEQLKSKLKPDGPGP